MFYSYLEIKILTLPRKKKNQSAKDGCIAAVDDV